MATLDQLNFDVIINEKEFDEQVERIKNKAFVQLVPTAIIFSFYQLANHQNPLDFFSHGLGWYWFTEVLFLFFVVYFTTSYISRQLHINHGLDIFLIIFALSLNVGSAYIKSHETPAYFDVLSLFNFCKYFQFFVVGLLCRKYENIYNYIFHSDKIYTLITCTFLCLFLILRLGGLGGMNHPILYQIFNHFILRYLGLAWLIGIFFRHDSFFNSDHVFCRYSQFLGRRTLDVYLLHFFFLPSFSWLPQEVLIACQNILFELLFVGIISLIIVALSLLVSAILRTSPILARYLLGSLV